MEEASFFLYDHLGNTRITYTPLEVNGIIGMRINAIVDYFPYGKVLREFYETSDKERYLTTQHERDEYTGLDYRGARYYDSDVSRFLSLDPLATKFPAWSAYNYVMGNPISLIDPDGKSPTAPPPGYNPLAYITECFAYYFGGIANLCTVESKTTSEVGVKKEISASNSIGSFKGTITSSIEEKSSTSFNAAAFFWSSGKAPAYQSSKSTNYKLELEGELKTREGIYTTTASAKKDLISGDNEVKLNASADLEVLKVGLNYREIARGEGSKTRTIEAEAKIGSSSNYVNGSVGFNNTSGAGQSSINNLKLLVGYKSTTSTQLNSGVTGFSSSSGTLSVIIGGR